MKEIQERLFALQDLEYRDFNSKLTPSVDKETVIGVRFPALRATWACSFSPSSARSMKLTAAI